MLRLEPSGVSVAAVRVALEDWSDADFTSDNGLRQILINEIYQSLITFVFNLFIYHR